MIDTINVSSFRSCVVREKGDCTIRLLVIDYVGLCKYNCMYNLCFMQI